MSQPRHRVGMGISKSWRVGDTARDGHLVQSVHQSHLSLVALPNLAGMGFCCARDGKRQKEDCGGLGGGALGELHDLTSFIQQGVRHPLTEKNGVYILKGWISSNQGFGSMGLAAPPPPGGCLAYEVWPRSPPPPSPHHTHHHHDHHRAKTI